MIRNKEGHVSSLLQLMQSSDLKDIFFRLVFLLAKKEPVVLLLLGCQAGR